MRLSIGDAIAALVVLPPLAYGFGFLMWVGPSRALYGVNVAPLLPAGALLLPGVIYLGVLGFAALLAALLGASSLANVGTRRSRTSLLVTEAVWWVLIIGLANTLAMAVAYGSPAKLLAAGWFEPVYLLIHLAVLAFGFRRLYGLLRARWGPPTPDRRTWSTRLRFAHSGTVLLVLFVQIPLALLFGVLGPNPAKNQWLATVQTADKPRHLMIIHRSSDELIGFDCETAAVIRLRLDDVREVIYDSRDTGMQPAGASRHR